MREAGGHGGLARPGVTADRAAEVAREHWGLTGTIRELGSQQDRNYLVEGERRVVLKVVNPATDPVHVDAQLRGLRELAAAGLTVPLPVPTVDGRDVATVDVGDASLQAYVLTFVEGTPLAEVERFGADEARLLGRTAGRVVTALADFRHPGTVRHTQWDLRAAADVVSALVRFVPQERRRAALAAAREDAVRRLAPLADLLPEQVIHADVTDDNLVVGPDGSVGVIDLGDLQRGWRVAEVAVACATPLAHGCDDPAVLLEVVRAFHEQVPLTPAELAALWPLVVLRTAVLVVSGEEQVRLDGDNEYADTRRAGEWRSFAVATSWDADEMEVLLRAAVGLDDAADRPRVGPLLPADCRPAVVDLSPMSPALDAGAWLEDGVEQRVLLSAAAEHGAATTRWGEHRLTRGRPHAPRGTSATLALGVDLALPAGTRLTAPFDGHVEAGDEGLALRGDALTLHLAGPVAAAGSEVRRGDPLGTVGASPGAGAVVVRAQLSTLPDARPPFLVTPRAERWWRRACPDPSPLLGTDVAVGDGDPAGLLARRDAAFAPVQEHYYRRPPQIERGWREFLVDTHAQVYVDAVNNVATLGHSHPRLVEAVSRQWALLNTNSRFHYAAVAELSERLAELAPEGLDTVFLVNSGSEAVDLALRLAITATGRPRVLAAREAYHGWTIGSDAVSTSIGDNPRALTSRPGWVELIDAPNAFRGTHRGPGASVGYLADLDRQLAGLGEEGRARLAGVILEPIFGNGGGVLLPEGYLAGVFERVRALGGVCISDEVQVGYGRLGAHFWGCEQQGARPDILTIAKAMGNGHPLGAVVTTREIADAFAAEGSLFSSAGGSPVSCRVGLTVLDVLRDERLQENARTVGGHFHARLSDLADQHPAIGAVHGMGLYLGVELVTDRTAFTPATELADRVCEALLERGCVVQPTGDHKNVLKIKPPMVITRASVDHVVDALDEVLGDLSG